MSVIYIALPVALLLVLVAFLAFYWCIQSGQLDELDNASYRMLYDKNQLKPNPTKCTQREK